MFERDATTGTGGVLRGAGAPAFRLERYAPPEDLADVVERFWTVRWSLPPGVHVTQTVLPHACVNLVAEPGLFAAHGIPSGRFDREIAGTGAVVGTKFRPGGFDAYARHVLGRRAARLGATRRDAVIPARDLLGDAAEVGPALLAAVGRGDDAAAVAQVVDVLRAARPGPPEADPALDQVHRAFAAVVGGRLGPDARVDDLAALAGLSTRTLQRLLRERVGVGPKWVLQRHRVHLAAELIAQAPDGDLAQVAARAGYYDQSHLTTDFAALAGITPGAYARRCADALQGAARDA
ncbi:AraC family transcriptional regulator [Cellulomonas fimi]|uniref:Transcriptional regulator, AraC family n=1 Tax=Cellulomonas fimi (strain ATCC 484 / DSM 20113 / JCM 1341 / CCUG 24087 / LMG 16345 / NBRC 15513 / NCIMB 8980 / NCTC 7547 / NRS-133) TaxID=590998 RepID=F4H2T3_CELFA|nr:helix-turn-helix domain-containing protein [Cellulomonas fimi]AEE46432.1 transcriptional regulator, AraC family [Cellulomonas fimi ATCC 484]NNH07724.1 AraC family transcriptional regulator [Cellulomonas fimi]VEH32973.1 Transcriptional activator feaR [Cellulomonas fimi]